MNLHEWIEIDRNYRREIQLKEQILNGPHRDDFFLCKDETYDAAMEVLTMFIDYLPHQYPNMFENSHSKSTITNLITRKTFDLTRSNHMHPLEIAARLVQEDLVIMQQHPTEETYHANVRETTDRSSWNSFDLSSVGFSRVFPIGMVTEIEIWFAFSLCSYASSAIFSRKTSHIDGEIFSQIERRQSCSTFELDL